MFSMMNWYITWYVLQLSCISKSVSKFCNTVLTSEENRIRATQLEAENIISTAHFSDWATPIFPVAKRDGSLHHGQVCLVTCPRSCC